MPPAEITKAAILGAGTMGPDIAAIFARHQVEVSLTDVDPAALERAERAVESALATLVEGGVITQEAARAGTSRVEFTTDQGRALDQAEFVLEAIPEQLDLKQALFQEIDDRVSPETILASNTSGIPIAQIAEAASRPERVIGTHWLNQPHVIPVVEVVKSDQTSPAVVEATSGLLRDLEMVPVLIHGNVPGFIHNRILFVIYREVLHLLEEGLVSAEDIDNVTKWAIGPKLTAVGPLELLDVAGLDTYQNVATYLNPDLHSAGDVSGLVRERVKAGQVGIKSGRGMYDYREEDLAALMKDRRRLMLEVVRRRFQARGGGRTAS